MLLSLAVAMQLVEYPLQPDPLQIEDITPGQSTQSLQIEGITPGQMIELANLLQLMPPGCDPHCQNAKVPPHLRPIFNIFVKVVNNNGQCPPSTSQPTSNQPDYDAVIAAVTKAVEDMQSQRQNQRDKYKEIKDVLKKKLKRDLYILQQ